MLQTSSPRMSMNIFSSVTFNEYLQCVLSRKDQTRHRSGVGMLVYLVKHSRSGISNAVRKLTKVLDGATNAHWKSLICTKKFVLDKLYALRLSTCTKNDG
jgi:hypothetical protein